MKSPDRLAQHNAPRVRYLVGRSRFYAGLLMFTWILGACLLTVWGMTSETLNWRHVLCAVTLSVLGVNAAGTWLRSPTATLAWNGHFWTWISRHPQQNSQVRISCHLDFQVALLLNVQDVHHSFEHWAWCERQQHPERWMALRRAVFSQVRSTKAEPVDSRGMLA